MSRTATRDELVKKFWNDVKEALTDKYGHLDSQAEEGIDLYRQDVVRRKLGEVTYNQGEEQAARVVDVSCAMAYRSRRPLVRAFALDALLAAKKLADQLGDVDAAKRAMDALSKLS